MRPPGGVLSPGESIIATGIGTSCHVLASIWNYVPPFQGK